MRSEGTIITRHTGNKQSALAILDMIISNRSDITLQIQREIASGKNVDETQAGQQLAEDILKERAEHQKQMAQMQQDMAKAIKENDAVAKAYITEIQNELQKKNSRWRGGCHKIKSQL